MLKNLLFLLLLFSSFTIHAQNFNSWIIINQSSSGSQLDQATSLKINGGGEIFVGTVNRGVFHFTQNEEWVNYTMSTSTSIPDNSITRILNLGNIYALTKYGGYAYFNGTSWISAPTLAHQNQNWSWINDLAPQGSHLWIATDLGLAIDSAGANTIPNRYFTTSTNPAIPVQDGVISSVRVDNSGRKWIGTEYEGLAVMNAIGDNIQVYDMSNSPLPSDDINFLQMHGNYLWIGTNAGLVRYDMSNEWVVYNISNTSGGLPSNQIKAILFHQGRTIIATLGGLGVMTPDGWYSITTSNSNLPSNSISDLAVHTLSQELWVSTLGAGLAKIALSEIPETIASVQKEKSFNEVTVYPNPTEDLLQFSFANLEEVTKVEIMKTTGEMVQTVKLPKGKIEIHNLDISDLSPGSYFLKIYMRDRFVFKKFIKS